MMKKFLHLISILLFWGCQTVPEPADKIYYITAERNNPIQRLAACSFRYRIDNSYSRLDNVLQQQAIRAAFDLWQDADQNIIFLQKQDAITAEVLIRFEEPAGTQKSETSSIGLIRGNLTTLSSSRQESNTYIIILDSRFEWDTHAITRVVAYHVGKFLGLNDSEETGSFLNRLYVNEALRLSVSDSLHLNALYAKPCVGGCNNFLPFSLPIGELVTKSIRVDKPGKITITASGSMIIGEFLGWSTPKGLEKGLIGIPIGDYSIDRSIWHAALIYKRSSDQKWLDCGMGCEFETDGVSQCIDITFAINDLDLSDNSGAYDVVIDYKK